MIPELVLRAPMRFWGKKKCILSLVETKFFSVLFSYDF